MTSCTSRTVTSSAGTWWYAARARGSVGSSAPAPPSGCTQRSSGMPAARAVSASVTSSAAPWFTNGLAVSDFGYGNETMRLSGPTVGDVVRVAHRRATTRTGWPRRRSARPDHSAARLGLRVGEAHALVGAQRVLVEREAVDARARCRRPRRAAARAPSSGWSSARPPASTAARRRPGGRGSPRGCPRRRRAARRGRRRRRCGPRPRRGRGSASRRRPGARGRGRATASSPRRSTDEPGEIVVRPRADRHELDRVDPVEQARAGVGLGRARGGEQQLERFGERDVVVVAVGDLADADDDRERAHVQEVAPPSSTTIAPDMYPASADAMNANVAAISSGSAAPHRLAAAELATGRCPRGRRSR